MERNALMRIATTGVLLALCGCGDSATNQTNNAAQSAAGASSPTLSMSAAGTPARASAPAAAGRAAPATGTPNSSTPTAATTTMTPKGGGSAGATAAQSGTSGTAAGSGGSAGTSARSGSSDKGSAGSAGSAGASTQAPESSAGSCLDGITDYDKDGPFMYEQKVEGAVNVWIPKVPAGCKVPIIHLANGTGANCLAYGAALTRMASHGFLATCYENPNTGSGSINTLPMCWTRATCKKSRSMSRQTLAGFDLHAQER